MDDLCPHYYLDPDSIYVDNNSSSCDIKLNFHINITKDHLFLLNTTGECHISPEAENIFIQVKET
jgi:hypothetical protein